MERLGALTRKRFGKQFRRKLGQFNYKVKKHGIRQINKKPGAIPLDLKVKLLEVNCTLVNIRMAPRAT